MADGFRIKTDVKKAERILDMSGRSVRRAAKRAINKTLGPAQTQASRQVQNRRNLRARDIKREISKAKAKRTLTATLTAKREAIPLHKFKGTRQTKKGVSVAQVPGQRSIWESAFMPWGKGEAVFKRLEGSRYPIQFQVGPGVGSALDSKPVRTAIDKSVESRWPKKFRHELDREVEKATRRARNRG